MKHVDVYIFRSDCSYFNKMHNNCYQSCTMSYKQSHLLSNMQKIVYYNFVYIQYTIKSVSKVVCTICIKLSFYVDIVNYLYYLTIYRYLVKSPVRYLVSLTLSKHVVCIFLYFLKSL